MSDELVGERTRMYVEKLAYELRGKGISVEIDHMNRSLKAQMKYADKLGVRYFVILSDNGIDNNKAIIKDMQSGKQMGTDLESLNNIKIENGVIKWKDNYYLD